MIVAAEGGRRHAYAALMYMGTRRDYKFYVVTRVMMRSLARLGVDADLVVIASADVPFHWVQILMNHGRKIPIQQLIIDVRVNSVLLYELDILLASFVSSLHHPFGPKT
ncbi:hypothetical protein GW17_00024188 [Ensete ventricosum]|nr:hypothetical protein GW17_00024188 [Ensete ventricosum]